ncbi:MAG: MFS transporter [Anaerolineales bacterium]|nr:MFS transporter [Anaerolineales bacterium]
MAAPTSPKASKLPIWLKISYSTGDLTTGIPQAVLMFFQLYFLTDVAGLRPDYAAWAIAAGRVWDAINDPLFGIFSDRIRSRFGRRRVLLLVGALPLGVAFALMWLVPNLGEVGLAVYYALVFILFDTCYTAVHVGYNSLTPELTNDYDERSSLNGYRMVYSISGSLGAVILATLLSGAFSDPRQMFAMLGLGLGLFCVIPPLIVFRVTRKYKSNLETEPLPHKEAILATIKNRPFQLVMGIYLLSWTTASVMAAVLVYFANYYLGVPEQANYFVVVAQGAAILFVPVIVWLARKLDKRRAFMIGSGSWIILLLIFFLLSPEQVMVVYLLAGLAGLGIATAYVIPWSMVPDVIEHDEMATGQRREGSYYAFASFFQKLGTGAALWAMGQALAMTGYINPVPGDPLPTQPDAAILAIRVFISLVPVGLLLLAIFFAWRYPITREYHHSLVEQLADMDN